MPVAYIVQSWLSLVLLGVTVIIEALAFVHCATRRADAFPVVGRLSKGTWVLMTLGALVFTLITLTTFFYGGNFLTSMIAIIAISVALVYLLDMRPAIRDVVEGHGGW